MSTPRLGGNVQRRLRGHADARVAYAEFEPLTLLADLQNDTALVGNFDGIAQQIDQNLHQAVTVGKDPRGQCRVDLAATTPSGVFDSRLEHLEGGVQPEAV